MFIGRKTELDYLNDLYQSDKAQFVTIYGRRRVGKTELITEFCKGKQAIFYSCSECTNNKQFEKFTDVLLDFDSSLRKQFARFSDWEDAFSILPDLVKEQKLVLVIDEFPYMVKGDKSIPSILQNLWDHKLRFANVMIILSGSSISFMEDEILAAKNPLYGRMTSIYKLEPLPFDDAIKFFPDYSYEDKIIAYSILGGIPHYLNQFNPNLPIEENIKKYILTKGSILFNEVEYILHQELREPAAYNTILEAVALGNNRYNEICQSSQIDSNNINPYLKGLIEIGLISHESPILTNAKQTAKKTQGEYKIADNFFHFWYSYAFPYISELIQGEVDNIWEGIIKNDLHNFASHSFENICIMYLRKQNRMGKLPFRFIKIGRWWGKVTHKDEQNKPYTVSEEIDVLACDKDENEFIIGECKFTNEPFDMGQFKKLQSKLTLKGNIHYYLFSLNGFTDAVTETAQQNDNLHLVSISDIFT